MTEPSAATDIGALARAVERSVDHLQDLLSNYQRLSRHLDKAERDLAKLKKRSDQPAVDAGEARFATGLKAFNWMLGALGSACLAALSLCLRWGTGGPESHASSSRAVRSGWQVLSGAPAVAIVFTLIASVGGPFVYMLALSVTRLVVRRSYTDGYLAVVMHEVGKYLIIWTYVVLACWVSALVACSFRLHSILIIDRTAVPLTFGALATAIAAAYARVIPLAEHMLMSPYEILHSGEDGSDDTSESKAD